MAFVAASGCRPWRADSPQNEVGSPREAPSAAASVSQTDVAASPSGDGAHAASALTSYITRLAATETETRERAAADLAALADGEHQAVALGLLVGALADPQAAVVRQARQSMGAWGERAVAPLVEALDDPAAEVRMQAALALDELGPQASGAIAALIDRLVDDDATVRETAAGALEKIGPAAVPPLIAQLSSEAGERRLQAARLLRRFGAEARQAVPTLVEALKDEDPDIHVAVASALYAIDPEAARAAGVE